MERRTLSLAVAVLFGVTGACLAEDAAEPLQLPPKAFCQGRQNGMDGLTYGYVKDERLPDLDTRHPKDLNRFEIPLKGREIVNAADGRSLGHIIALHCFLATHPTMGLSPHAVGDDECCLFDARE